MSINFRRRAAKAAKRRAKLRERSSPAVAPTDPSRGLLGRLTAAGPLYAVSCCRSCWPALLACLGAGPWARIPGRASDPTANFGEPACFRDYLVLSATPPCPCPKCLTANGSRRAVRFALDRLRRHLAQHGMLGVRISSGPSGCATARAESGQP
jgi:hypothetical protein